MSDASRTTTKKEVPVLLDPETVEAIEDRLDYGDSRSAWIRRAVRDRLQVDQRNE